MRNEAQVLQALKRILSENFSIEAEAITPEASFRGSLGLDSLDAVDLVFFIQDAFGLKDSLDAYRELHTVASLCAYVCARR